MRRLLTTDTEPALIGYLSLLRDDGTRDEALALAVEMPQIPIATFVGLLDYKEESVRLSAAILLGHLNNAEVTQQLITRLTKKPSDSTEAWMALMACHDELAGRFLAYATERPQLLGHFNTARVRWAQMIP
jgi:HEAT repeat protein